MLNNEYEISDKEKKIIESIIKEELKKRNKHHYLLNGIRFALLSMAGTLTSFYITEHILFYLVLALVIIVGVLFSGLYEWKKN